MKSCADLAEVRLPPSWFSVESFLPTKVPAAVLGPSLLGRERAGAGSGVGRRGEVASLMQEYLSLLFWGLLCDGTPQPTGGSLPTADASPRPSESGSGQQGGAPPGPHTGHSQAVLTGARYLKLHVHYVIAAGPCVIDKSPAAPVNSPCLSTAADVSTTSWPGFLRANKLPSDRNGLADGSGLEVTTEPGSSC